ncbi:MAG: RagB/SusD family nutrient uptake outer membrane protein [Sphingobacterium composti]
MKRILIINIVGLFLLMHTSCKNMLDIDSTRLVNEENMWTSMEDTRAALMGIYGLTKAALNDQNAHWIYGEVRTNEFVIPARQDLKAVASHNLNATFSTLESLSNWRRWYAVVNAANIFLERSIEVKNADSRYTDNNFNVDNAQARFLRAFAYFYMTRIWGDVPLIVSSSEGSFLNRPREDQGKVLAWAEKEMLDAAQVLPYRYSVNDEQQLGNYYNETSGRWDGTLVRKITAYAILAHLAAWQGDYPNSASYSKFVLDNYSRASVNYITTATLTNRNGFFNGKNINQLFGFASVWSHVEGYFTGYIEELTLAAPVVNKNVPEMYMGKETIMSIFNEIKDERFAVDTLGRPLTDVYFTNFNGRYPIFSKIKSIQGGGTDPSFRLFNSATVLTRLEDIALLRAESLTVLGEESGAIELLNTVRERRGLDPYNRQVNGDLIDAIFRERHRELMGEGHRWYDIVRYHKIRKIDKAYNELIENGGIYWPIAQSVLAQNSKLNQNNYWK